MFVHEPKSVKRENLAKDHLLNIMKAVKKKYSRIALVQTTVSSRREAQKLSLHIIKKRLGACVQTMPITSLFCWHGKTDSADEFLLSIKTTPLGAARLMDFIKKNHSYELPEIIITRVCADRDYADWVAEETGRPGGANL